MWCKAKHYQTNNVAGYGGGHGAENKTRRGNDCEDGTMGLYMGLYRAGNDAGFDRSFTHIPMSIPAMQSLTSSSMASPIPCLMPSHSQIYILTLSSTPIPCSSSGTSPASFPMPGPVPTQFPSPAPRSPHLFCSAISQAHPSHNHSPIPRSKHILSRVAQPLPYS